MGLCEIPEEGSAGPVSAFAPDSCMTRKNATSLGCGVRVVKHPSCSGIHSGVLATFCWGLQK